MQLPPALQSPFSSTWGVVMLKKIKNGSGNKAIQAHISMCCMTDWIPLGHGSVRRCSQVPFQKGSGHETSPSLSWNFKPQKTDIRNANSKRMKISSKCKIQKIDKMHKYKKIDNCQDHMEAYICISHLHTQIFTFLCPKFCVLMEPIAWELSPLSLPFFKSLIDNIVWYNFFFFYIGWTLH